MDIGRLDQKKAIFQRLGETMLACAQTGVDDLWLFAKAGDGWVEISLFEIGEGTLTWCDPEGRLTDSLFTLWEVDPPDQRWYGMAFEVHGQSFTTEFYFDGELPGDEVTGAARELLISRRFANFTVIYSSHQD
jgi:hypothetical protein